MNNIPKSDTVYMNLGEIATLVQEVAYYEKAGDNLSVPPIGDRGMHDIDAAIMLHIIAKLYDKIPWTLLPEERQSRLDQIWVHYQRSVNF